MAKVTNILAGDGFRGDLSSIVSTTTAEEKKQLRDQFFKDLADNAVAVPVGIAEGAVGLPGDIEGLARGAYRAYNAEDGDRLDAFSSAFGDTFIPSTQQIQEFTNENLFDNEIGEMIKRGKYGRLAGEFVAPATLITAPSKTLAKGASALADTSFFKTLANPLGVDTALSIVNKADDVDLLLSKADDIDSLLSKADDISDALPKRLTHDIKYKIDDFNGEKVFSEVVEPKIFNNRNNFKGSNNGVPNDYLDFLHTKANRNDTIGRSVPKDAPIQPATNTFYDDIRMNEPFPEPTKEVFEFTKGSKHSKGGPVSQFPGGGHYEMPTYEQRYSDRLFGDTFVNPNERDAFVHSHLAGPEKLGGYSPTYDVQQVIDGQELLNKKRTYRDTDYIKNWYDQNFIAETKPEGTFIPVDIDNGKSDTLDILRNKNVKNGTFIDKSTYVTDGLTENKIRNMQGVKPRNLEADKAWVTSAERPYDTTQFIRDTQGKDGGLFADLARENSREYGGMFDNVISSDGYSAKNFERTANEKYITPHTGTFVQDIKSSPRGSYNKLDLGKTNVQTTKDLQKQVDTAVDIANNNIRYATPEDKLDAFVKAMDKIEEVNAKYVRRGKPTKTKEDAMNYLWQIHDDLVKEAMGFKDKLYPQRSVTGERMFKDNPTIDQGASNNVELDDYIRDLYEGNANPTGKGYYD